MRGALIDVGDPDEAALLADVLAEAGIASRTDPASAVPPLVVFTDVGRPDDGASLRDRLAAFRERWGPVPVVLLAAYRAAAEDALSLGADAVILKPYDVDEIIAAAADLALSAR